MNYIIRKMRKEDCAAFNHVITVSWNEAYKGIVPNEFLEELKSNEKERTEKGLSIFDEKDVNTFILEIDGEVVGFSHYAAANQDKFPGCGEIRALYIINKYHKNGFGRKLVDESKKELKKLGFDKMIICCLKDNLPSNEFYKHIGGKFIREGVYERLQLPENIYYYEI